MISRLTNLIEDKKILILGFGKEGQSTYHLIQSISKNAILTIADQNTNHSVAKTTVSKDQHLILKLGKTYLEEIKKYELVFKSPGINLHDVTFPPTTIVSSQTQLFLEAYSSQTIGITGTKGKSTTASLIHHILSQAGKDSVLIGNIGIPPFSAIKKIKPNTIIVFELSAHQLENIQRAPHLGILLNIFQEHLDYFQNFEKYRSGKSKIFTAQKSGDLFIFNVDQKELHQIVPEHQLPNYKTFSLSNKNNENCYVSKGIIYLKKDKSSIPIIKTKDIHNLIGEHNQYNIMAAILACSEKNLLPEEIKTGIESFKSLEHRLEYVGKFKGIIFYNDSISTIPEATIEAIKSLPETATLILGGFDRGIYYEDLIDFLILSKIRNFIFMGPAGNRMKAIFKSKQYSEKLLFSTNSFKEVFQHVIKVTPSGKICLLSPAASSYDLFKNFEERGQVYKKTARNL